MHLPPCLGGCIWCECCSCHTHCVCQSWCGFPWLRLLLQALHLSLLPLLLRLSNVASIVCVVHVAVFGIGESVARIAVAALALFVARNAFVAVAVLAPLVATCGFIAVVAFIVFVASASIFRWRRRCHLVWLYSCFAGALRTGRIAVCRWGMCLVWHCVCTSNVRNGTSITFYTQGSSVDMRRWRACVCVCVCGGGGRSVRVPALFVSGCLVWCPSPSSWCVVVSAPLCLAISCVYRAASSSNKQQLASSKQQAAPGSVVVVVVAIVVVVVVIAVVCVCVCVCVFVCLCVCFGCVLLCAVLVC